MYLVVYICIYEVNVNIFITKMFKRMFDIILQPKVKLVR